MTYTFEADPKGLDMTATYDEALGKYLDVSDPAGEPVAVWERISTDSTRQEIKLQTKATKDYLRAHGPYNVVRVFSFEASAFKGEHVPQQAELEADIAAGKYRTVVSAMTSRNERQGWQYAMYFGLHLYLKYGARIVSVDDSSYGDMSSLQGGMQTMFKSDSDYQYSKAIQDNVRRAFRSYDADNIFRGAIPSGYDSVGPDKAKQLAPHPVGGPAMTEAFVDAANGKSTPAIARTFKRINDEYNRDLPEGARRLRLPETWQGVQKVMHNDLYSTGIYRVHRHDGTVYNYHGPALVSPAQQRAAMAALNARHTGDNITSRAIRKDDFSGALRCAACGTGRMYRYYATKRRRYRCDNLECHKTVHGPNTDEQVNEIMAAYSAPWYVHRTEDLNAERDRRIANIDEELDNLNRTARINGWTRQQKRDVEDALFEQRDRLAAVPDRDPVSHVDVRHDGDRELTEGDHWLTMTMGERRDLLTGGSIYVYVKATVDRSGRVVVDVEREE